MNARQETIGRLVFSLLRTLLDDPGSRRGPKPRPRPVLRVERVEEFLRSQAEEHNGEKVPAKFVWEQFVNWLPENERDDWNRIRFYRVLQKSHEIKAGTGNRRFVHGILLRMGGGFGI